MDPTLQSWVNQSATFTANLPDQNQLAELFLTATLFRVPTDNATLTTYPDGMDRLSADQLKHLQLWQTAKRLSLPLDGPTIFNIAQAATAPSIVQPMLGFAHWNVLFRYLKLY